MVIYLHILVFYIPGFSLFKVFRIIGSNIYLPVDSSIMDGFVSIEPDDQQRKHQRPTFFRVIIIAMNIFLQPTFLTSMRQFMPSALNNAIYDWSL